MLVKFYVENFLSFKEETCLDMVAATGDSKHPNHVVAEKEGKKIPLLRTAALYGANASGKSNLVKAIAFAQELIIEGTKSGESIPVVPFKLDKTTHKKPSKFEFLINYKDYLYTYGFVLNTKKVIEEWLFVTPPKKREVKYFERTTSNNNKVNVDIGNSMAKKNTKKHDRLIFLAQGTRHNQLFLTEANERNVDEIKSLMEWFIEVLNIIEPDAYFAGLELYAHSSNQFVEFLGDFLNIADTGIESINLERSKLNIDKHLSHMPTKIKNEMLDELRKKPKSSMRICLSKNDFNCIILDSGEPLLVNLKMNHRIKGGSTIRFRPNEESDGTIRLMNLIPALIFLKEKEKVFLIDEIDRSIHPILSKLFVQFYADQKKPTRGQLIFTTHESHLLDQDLLRRDEINFVEKDENGSSNIYSLVEFKIRPDLKIDKGYLHGRFGAIPFFGDTEKLGLKLKS